MSNIRESEPIAHCYLCLQAIKGTCAEYNALNPKYEGGYDRKYCLWGSKNQCNLILEKDGIIVWRDNKLC